MLSVVTYLWNDPLMEGSKGVHRGVVPNPHAAVRADLLPSYRQLRRGVVSKYPKQQPLYAHVGALPARNFTHEHAITLATAIRRQLTVPHRFICVTDSLPGDMTPQGVEWVEMPAAWRALGNLRSPEGSRFPSCYRRLGGFSAEARALLGERTLVMDVDLVPVRNMDHLVARTEDFVGWRPFRDWGKKLRFGGGLYLHTPGTRTDVFTRFKGASAINAAKQAGYRGSDQAWISYMLAEKEPYYARNSGIYSIRDLGADHALPRDACLVQFNGHQKPWSYRGPATWVAEHWHR